jgi:hypothetical protein
MRTEKDVLKALRDGNVALPPLRARLVEPQPKLRALAGDRYQPDAIIELARRSGRPRRWKFLAELKAQSTPQAFDNALRDIQPAAAKTGMNPMIVLPYLSPENLARLEQADVSGLDLCGNGVITVPGELLVVRTGQPNRFPRSEPIRNVYRGDSSLVGRSFLLRPTYGAVGQIVTTIKSSGADISFATVSKVLKTLEADLIVGRSQEQGIQLLQADKLLDELAANYRAPKVIERRIGKLTISSERELPQAVMEGARRIGANLILTGAASASRYSVLAREPIVAVYCNVSPTDVLAAVGGRFEETDRFPNVDLIHTEDRPPYFDAATEGGIGYSSPVQAYLELMAGGDKRQRETADQVRQYVLRRVREYRPRA